MTAEGHPGDGRVEAAVPDGSRRSFHSNLLIRSEEKLPEYRRPTILFKMGQRWGRVGDWLGQGAIFAGGLAIGGGSMLIRRGEEAKEPGLMITAGIGCVLFAVLARLAAIETTKRGTTSARS